MDKIFDAISNVITETAGGLLAFWAAMAYFFVKFLKWCGAKIAEGANNDLVKKITPYFDKWLSDKLEPIQKEMAEIKESLASYKKIKHSLESERDHLIQVIIEDDEELTQEVRNLLIKHKKL